MSSDKLRKLFEGVKAGDLASISKFLSHTEARGIEIFKEIPELMGLSPNPCPRLGITGPPGAGKSTLISGLIKELRAKGLKVAVLAVDPSSPFTKGAILGDRIRYSDHFLDEGVFIRSLGSRGSLGGLSAAAYLMLRVLDWAHFDVVLIETVGVGQTELEIVNVADLVAVVLVPESGDSVQAMKAGLTEIADLFIVNKADRPGAESLAREIEIMEAMGDKPSPVKMTVASRGEGLLEVAELCWTQLHSAKLSQTRAEPERLKQEALALLRSQSEKEILSQLEGRIGPESFEEIITQRIK